MVDQEHQRLAKTDAVELATTVGATLEGGFILARTRRDGDILRSIGRRIHTLVAATLAAATPAPETNTPGA